MPKRGNKAMDATGSMLSHTQHLAACTSLSFCVQVQTSGLANSSGNTNVCYVAVQCGSCFCFACTCRPNQVGSQFTAGIQRYVFAVRLFTSHTVVHCVCLSEDKEDKAKISFCTEALLRDEGLFEHRHVLDDGLAAAIKWQCSMADEAICAHIEQVIAQIERVGKELIASGAASAWFEGADSKIRNVAAGVNAPLMQLLANACKFHDCDCIDFFRRGAPLVDALLLIPVLFGCATHMFLRCFARLVC